MRSLTTREEAFYAAHPSSAMYTCRDCGRTDQGYWVQPQPPWTCGGAEHVALCADCIAQHNHNAAKRRTAQLAAMASCEVPECSHRGTWRSMGVLLCGRHLSKVKAEHTKAMASVGGMGLFLTVSYDRASILDMAQRTGRA